MSCQSYAPYILNERCPQPSHDQIEMARTRGSWGFLHQCPVCKGNGTVPLTFGDCTECDGTGKVCPQHGKRWRK